jgi:hypothetical protein
MNSGMPSALLAFMQDSLLAGIELPQEKTS